MLRLLSREVNGLDIDELFMPSCTDSNSGSQAVPFPTRISRNGHTLLLPFHLLRYRRSPGRQLFSRTSLFPRTSSMTNFGLGYTSKAEQELQC
jgi:hypothetical protein